MFDLETAKKPQLVDIVTRLQVARGCVGDDLWRPGNRARARVAELAARIATLLGTDLTLSDDGTVAPVENLPPATGAEAEPTRGGSDEVQADTPPANPVIAAFQRGTARAGSTFPVPSRSTSCGRSRRSSAPLGPPAVGAGGHSSRTTASSPFSPPRTRSGRARPATLGSRC
jgi:hypothetical protein